MILVILRVNEWLSLNAKSAIFQLEQVMFWWDGDEVRFVLEQHAEMDFRSASSLKQQSTGRHVAQKGYIILILSQPFFSFTV
jgi:hypothetical protein